MTKPMNFAVIGCGMLARSQHIPNIAASDRMVLHTCIDLSDDALAECKGKHGALHIGKDYEKAIADPDIEAICLATHESLRLPVIKAAMEAGKPIYTEKPMAPTLEEAYEIHKVVTAAKVPFCVGHNRRNAPAMIEGQRIFSEHMADPKPCPWRFQREGTIPKLPDHNAPCMSARINDDYYSWKGYVFDNDETHEGPMLFEMTHFTDVCNWFMGSEPAEVVAIEGGMLNHGTIIRYANGGVATITMGGNGTFGYPKELYEVWGGGAIMIVDHMLEIRTAGIDGAPARKTYPMLGDRHPNVGTEGGFEGYMAKKRVACEEAAASGDTWQIFTAEPDKGHARALERFIDEIRGDGPQVCGVDSALAATRVSFAAIESARSGKAVDMKGV
jgi:predicted dehydrogenase